MADIAHVHNVYTLRREDTCARTLRTAQEGVRDIARCPAPLEEATRPGDRLSRPAR